MCHDIIVILVPACFLLLIASLADVLIDLGEELPNGFFTGTVFDNKFETVFLFEYFVHQVKNPVS